MCSGPTSRRSAGASTQGLCSEGNCAWFPCLFLPRESTNPFRTMSPHFQVARGPVIYVLSGPTLRAHKHTQAHTTISQMTLDAQESGSPFKDSRKTLFAFPCFLEGGVCMHVCVFAGVCRSVGVASCQMEPVPRQGTGPASRGRRAEDGANLHVCGRSCFTSERGRPALAVYEQPWQ